MDRLYSYREAPKYDENIEREIYEKWLKKCQDEAEYTREKKEQNIFRKIQDDRDRLVKLNSHNTSFNSYNNYNRLTSPEYMPKEIPSVSKSETISVPLSDFDYGSKYNLYTLDGFPRRNFRQFYVPKSELINGYGIKRGSTDITNNELKDKINNLSYDEYKAKQKEFLNFNQHTVKDNVRYKDYLFHEKRKINEERLRESERLKEMEYQEKLLENEKKKIYKELLDDQLKIKVPSKLGNDYYSPMIKDKTVKFSNPNLYQNIPENSFMNRNKLVEINPYSLKPTSLGASMLDHNPITNPVFDYKYNRYLFPRMPSPFQNAGYAMVNNNNKKGDVGENNGIDYTKDNGNVDGANPGGK